MGAFSLLNEENTDHAVKLAINAATDVNNEKHKTIPVQNSGVAKLTLTNAIRI